MREILFRGKSKINGEWVYGFYSGENCSEIFSPMFKQDNIIIKGSGFWVEVDPETVGEFTGLTDKDGTGIFEGDILQGDEYPYCSDGNYNYYAEVVWFDDGCCGFGLCTHKNPKSTVRGISDGNCEWFEDFDSNNWSVVGNIYDNPELIGGDDK